MERCRQREGSTRGSNFHHAVLTESALKRCVRVRVGWKGGGERDWERLSLLSFQFALPFDRGRALLRRGLAELVPAFQLAFAVWPWSWFSRRVRAGFYDFPAFQLVLPVLRTGLGEFVSAFQLALPFGRVIMVSRRIRAGFRDFTRQRCVKCGGFCDVDFLFARRLLFAM